MAAIGTSLMGALETRFYEDATLSAIGRKLFFGYESDRQDSILPYVQCDFLSGDDMDSFGVDREEFNIQFTAFTKSLEPFKCSEIMDRIMRVYDDRRNLTFEVDDLVCCAFRKTDKRGPYSVDKTYQGTIDYTIIVERLPEEPESGSMAGSSGSSSSNNSSSGGLQSAPGGGI